MNRKQDPVTSQASGPLTGNFPVPGDKSISHRALMLGAMAEGETIISGLLEAGDVFSTVEALRAMGASLALSDDGLWRVQGVGVLKEPTQILDMGNSGTSARLLTGIIAGYPMTATMSGDSSLIKRPMARVMIPLERMGARFLSRTGQCLPMTMQGSSSLTAIEYTLSVASAQVKSAILLAGLHADGLTTVIEDKLTRDHTEIMLKHFGVDVETETTNDGAQAISIRGGQCLSGAAIDIPGDPSAAAFPVIAALIVPGSDINLSRVGMNPRRDGLYVTLKEMGADIVMDYMHSEFGEKIVNLHVRFSEPLKGIIVPPERIPRMIDEIPALAMAASCARGITVLTNLGELRVKESDRLKMIAEGLAACGVRLEMEKESLIIHGTGIPPDGGAVIETALDHRIAMSFLCLGLVTKYPVTIDDFSPVMTSFPNFMDSMTSIGAILETGASDRIRELKGF